LATTVGCTFGKFRTIKSGICKTKDYACTALLFCFWPAGFWFPADRYSFPTDFSPKFSDFGVMYPQHARRINCSILLTNHRLKVSGRNTENFLRSLFEDVVGTGKWLKIISETKVRSARPADGQTSFGMQHNNIGCELTSASL
jgi:hypothetical protein